MIDPGSARVDGEPHGGPGPALPMYEPSTRLLGVPAAFRRSSHCGTRVSGPRNRQDRVWPDRPVTMTPVSWLGALPSRAGGGSASRGPGFGGPARIGLDRERCHRPGRRLDGAIRPHGAQDSGLVPRRRPVPALAGKRIRVDDPRWPGPARCCGGQSDTGSDTALGAGRRLIP